MPKAKKAEKAESLQLTAYNLQLTVYSLQLRIPYLPIHLVELIDGEGVLLQITVLGVVPVVRIEIGCIIDIDIQLSAGILQHLLPTGEGDADLDLPALTRCNPILRGMHLAGGIEVKKTILQCTDIVNGHVGIVLQHDCVVAIFIAIIAPAARATG